MLFYFSIDCCFFFSISVPNPFPAASSNLQKTLSQMCAKQNYKYVLCMVLCFEYVLDFRDNH